MSFPFLGVILACQYINLRINTIIVQHIIIEKNVITLSRSLGVNLYSFGGANFLFLQHNFFNPDKSAIIYTPFALYLQRTLPCIYAFILSYQLLKYNRTLVLFVVFC
ncbi:hypothetical protein JOD02_001183 [Caldicoprobacter guelmensis]|nr:hypothetical protein [Caldicoprobacter guelmensis]